jgi:hypothetical protein
MAAGAYVLGALPPAQRLEFQQHLSTCPTCRAEVADLAGLPGLLGRLDEQAAAELDTEPAPPRSLLPEALTRLTRARRRQRWHQALVAAAVVLVALAGVGAAVWRSDGASGVHAPVAAVSPEAVNLSPMQPANEGPVRAEIALVPEGTGTRVEMHCVYLTGSEYPQKPWHLMLVVYPKGGGAPGPAVVNWTAPPGANLAVTGVTPLRPDQIDRIELRRGDGTMLLSYPVT